MNVKKVIKNGDRYVVTSGYDKIEYMEVRSRTPNEEAAFAMSMIEKWALGVGRNEALMKPEEAVERAFTIARLTYQHIKDNRMSTPFPMAKVFGKDGE